MWEVWRLASNCTNEISPMRSHTRPVCGRHIAAPRQHHSPRVIVHPTSGAAQRLRERRRIRRQSSSPPDELAAECWSLLDCLACWLDKNDSCVFRRASLLSLTIEDCVEYIALICSAVAAFRSQRSEKWKPGLTAHGGDESVWQQTRNLSWN